MELRNYQKQAIQAVDESMAKGQNKPILVLATGLGKTVIFSHGIANRFANTGKKALVIAHREELLKQAKEKIETIEPNLNVQIEMADQHADSDAHVIVASVATIGRAMSSRISKFDPRNFSTVVIDEAHHASAQSYKNILQYFGLLKADEHLVPRFPASATDWNKDCLLLGVTATPSRNDNKGIDQIFDDVVFNYGIVDGIKDGWLSRIRAYRVDTATSLEEVHTRTGDFAQEELADAVNNKERNDLIVQTYKDKFEGKQILMFAVDTKHAYDLWRAFYDNEIMAAYVDGNTPKEERAQLLQDFEDKKIQVMVNCMVLTEGYDNPTIDAVFMARPTKSGILYTQMIGRGTRKHEDKPYLTVVDFVDNTYKHTIKSAASLLGLDATVQFGGEDVVDAYDKIKEIQELSPDYNLNNLDMTKLDYIMEEVDLLSGLSIPTDLEGLTKLAWQRFGQDAYRINLGNNDYLVIEQSLTGQYKVRRDEWDSTTRKLAKEELGECNTLLDAVERSDKYIENNYSEQMILVDTKARWRKAPIKDKQVAALQRLGVDKAIIDQLDRGKASALQNKLYSKRTLQQQWNQTAKKANWR